MWHHPLCQWQHVITVVISAEVGCVEGCRSFHRVRHAKNCPHTEQEGRSYQPTAATCHHHIHHCVSTLGYCYTLCSRCAGSCHFFTVVRTGKNIRSFYFFSLFGKIFLVGGLGWVQFACFLMFNIFFNVFFIFFCFTKCFFVFLMSCFLFLLKHIHTKLQIWFVSHGQIVFSYFWSVHLVCFGF